MEITKQTINPPACYKCDDIGYTPGNEVFGVARCDCAIGVTADMRAPGAIIGVVKVGKPEYVFANGMLRISTDGMTYNGETILDAGRAYRAFIATMEGRKPDAPLLERAYDLIDEARNAGQVLTIALVPLKPLAMGNYEMVADLRPARERERAKPEELGEPVIVVGLQKSLRSPAYAYPDAALYGIGTRCQSAEPELTQDERNKRASRALEAIVVSAPRSLLDGAMEAYKEALVLGQGAYVTHPDGSTEHVPAHQLRPIKTMAFPDRRTEARKVIWPTPDPAAFTLERRDPHSTLSQEDFDKRQEDRRKREAK